MMSGFAGKFQFASDFDGDLHLFPKNLDAPDYQDRWHVWVIQSDGSRKEAPLDTPVENLRNLGPTSAQWLREIGVHTRGDLERLGPVTAYRLVKQRQLRTSLNLLWAMVAALSDRGWQELAPEEKERLRNEAEDE